MSAPGSSNSSSSSTTTIDPTLQRIENEAIRAALPHGLLDQRGQDLKQQLDWCLMTTNWVFSAGKALALLTQC